MEAAWKCLGLDDQARLGTMLGTCETEGDSTGDVKLGTLAYKRTGGLCNELLALSSWSAT